MYITIRRFKLREDDLVQTAEERNSSNLERTINRVLLFFVCKFIKRESFLSWPMIVCNFIFEQWVFHARQNILGYHHVKQKKKKMKEKNFSIYCNAAESRPYYLSCLCANKLYQAGTGKPNFSISGKVGQKSKSDIHADPRWYIVHYIN